MTAPTEDIHSCSMYCTRPACVLAQRDELRDSHGAGNQVPPTAQPATRKDCGEAGCAEDRCGNAGCLPSAQPAAQPVQPQGWQPIETAPKDGQEFVTANSMQGFVKELVSWNRIHGYWQSKGKSIHMQATHWMPLPARPGGAS